MKKVFIKTYGCQMNVYDSERMAELLAEMSYHTTDDSSDADLLLLNTCHIREKSSEKIYSELGRWRVLGDERVAKGKSRPLIAVAGCVAQAEGAELLTRAPYVSLVVGPQTYPRLPHLLRRAEAGERCLLDTEFPLQPKFDLLPTTVTDTPFAANLTTDSAATSRFLAIQEGCDKFCSFCVVPYTRGAEYSRPMADILAEARQMVRQGAREITLLGQNVNGWGKKTDGLNLVNGGKSVNFGRLLHELAEIDGVLRLRYMTSHPLDVDDDLIAAHRDIPQLMPFLHLPVQSGSDRILAAMNRRHTADDYLKIIDKLREARPNIAFSSDFIVGFPGESDEDFAATLDLIARVGFVQSFSFKYSPRPGTPAANRQDMIDSELQNQRLAVLQDILQRDLEKFNDSCVGRVVEILWEKPGRHAGQIIGKTPWLQPVVLSNAAPHMLGSVTRVTLESRNVYSFNASLLGERAA